MELFTMFRQMGMAALFSIIVSFLPLIAAGCVSVPADRSSGWP